MAEITKQWIADRMREIMKHKPIDKIRVTEIESAVYLGLYLGLRRSEVAGLRLMDVDFKHDMVHIRNTIVRFNTVSEQEKTKSKASKRDLFLPAGLKDYLIKLKEKQKQNHAFLDLQFSEESHVCQWADGRPYQPDYISWRNVGCQKSVFMICGIQRAVF